MRAFLQKGHRCLMADFFDQRQIRSRLSISNRIAEIVEAGWRRQDAGARRRRHALGKSSPERTQLGAPVRQK
jgi:hypothetical protein